MKRSTSRLYLYLASGLTLLAFALRLHNLGSDSLWYDEILTATTARSDLLTVCTSLGKSSDHPPLLYLLTNLALRLGKNDFVIRLPSAMLGFLAIPVVYRLGCLWSNHLVGVLGALLLTLSPFHIRYCQEARHYALLTLTAAASLLFLWQGLARGKGRWWLGFALTTALGLYTHYTSLVVLTTEMLFAGLALGVVWIREQRPARYVWHTVLRLGLGVFLAITLYGPWIPSLSGHLAKNLGLDTNIITAADAIGLEVPLRQRMTNAFYAFGISQSMAYLIGGLCLLGWISWLCRSRWQQVALSSVWLTVPFLLVQITGRPPFPKYVIYVLPVYLLTAAAGLQTVASGLAALWPRRLDWTETLSMLLVVSAVIAVSVSAIGDVYRDMTRDWSGAVEYLKGLADEGDLFITATLDLSSGFDQGAIALPYYLGDTFDTYHMLSAANVTPEVMELENVAQKRKGVWAVVLNRHTSMSLKHPDLNVVPFQGSLYLVYSSCPEQTALEQTIFLFETLASLARSPQPREKILFDLVALYNFAQQFEAASEVLGRISGLPSTMRQYDIVKMTHHGLLEKYTNENQEEKVQATAWKLLKLDSKDEAALQALTVYDFIAGLPEAEIGAPKEPFQHVEIRTFTMPQSGDWKSVLFMHPPAAVSYTLTLPEEPTELRFSVAMAPESWEWGGDGATFVINLLDEAGEQHALFSQHISNRLEDRRWHETFIDLSSFVGQEVIITLMTEPGPQMDFTGDWAGWGLPRIVWPRTN